MKQMVTRSVLAILILLLVVPSTNAFADNCNGRINNPDLLLKRNEEDKLCTMVKLDSRFLFNIQKSISGNDNYFNSLANNMFMEKCKNYIDTCLSGFLVSVFPDQRKVRITAGSAVSNVATMAIRTQVIDAMKPFLKRNDFLNALSTSYEMLKAYKPVKTFKKVTTYTSYTSNSTTSSAASIVWALIFIAILIGIIYCCIQREQQLKQEHQQHFSPEEIYIHISKLEGLIRQTRTISPMVKVDWCLICFNNIIYNGPTTSEGQGMVSNDINDTFNTRFDCDHVFHTACIGAKKVNFCLLCKSTDYSTPSLKVANRSSVQFVTEPQLNIMINNLKFLYSKDQIKSYTTCYPDQYHSYNNVIIIDDYNYYHGYGNGYRYGDGYYDTGYNNNGYTKTNTEYVEDGVVDTGVVDSAGGGYGGGEDRGDY